jgi:hypothetical protein
MPTTTKLPLRLIETAPRVSARVQSAALQTLNEWELQSIYNLFAWVAEEQDTAREKVQDITAVRFEVGDVTELARKDYDEVIRFLVDLRIDELGD